MKENIVIDDMSVPSLAGAIIYALGLMVMSSLPVVILICMFFAWESETASEAAPYFFIPLLCFPVGMGISKIGAFIAEKGGEVKND